MAPPHKRRRLTGPIPRPLPLHSDFSVIEPSPTLAHSVEHLKHRPTPSGTRTVPQRIEEIHLQIQERPVSEHVGLRRRQASDLVSSVDAAAVSAVTAALGTGSSTSLSSDSSSATDSSSSLSSSQTSSEASNETSSQTSSQTASQTSSQSSSTSSDANGFIGSSPSGTGASSSSNSSSTHSITSSPSGPLSTGTANITSSDHNSGNSTHSGTSITGSNASLNGSSASYTSQHSSPGQYVFLTTLKNGRVQTVSESNKPYLTTFGDGSIATICDISSDCTLSTGTSSPHSTTSGSTSSYVPSTTTSVYGVAGGGSTGGGTTTTAATSSTSSAVHHSSNYIPPATQGTIAGGVVGGAAGLAVIAFVALVFFKWYKRRSQNGHQALPPSSGQSPDNDAPASVSREPGMAERAGMPAFVAAVPALFRHQNRSQEEPAPAERGFTRVAGRKLPSAFSEGMTSGGMSGPPPSMPLRDPEGNLSTTSFYRDSDGFHGGEGGANELPASPVEGPVGPMTHGERGEMVLSPGPRRTPTVHRGGPYVMSPSQSTPASPHSPAGTAGTVPTFDRSSTPSTVPDNRSSRFTEEV